MSFRNKKERSMGYEKAKKIDTQRSKYKKERDEHMKAHVLKKREKEER